MHYTDPQEGGIESERPSRGLGRVFQKDCHAQLANCGALHFAQHLYFTTANLIIQSNKLEYL